MTDSPALVEEGREPSEGPTWKYVVYFGAHDGEIEALADKLSDAVEMALGCTEKPDHACRFHGSSTGPIKQYKGRRWALRWAFDSLWRAIRYGEVT